MSANLPNAGGMIGKFLTGPHSSECKKFVYGVALLETKLDCTAL